MWHDKWVAHMKEEARQIAVREVDPPAISHKTWQAENLDVLLGRTRLATAAPFPACPRTAVLRLALCPSVSRVLPFTFVLNRLHSIAIFSVHTIQALCFSNFFSKNHIFFCLSHHGTVSIAKFPSFLYLMMMGSSCSLPLFIVPCTAPPAPPKSKRLEK